MRRGKVAGLLTRVVSTAVGVLYGCADPVASDGVRPHGLSSAISGTNGCLDCIVGPRSFTRSSSGTPIDVDFIGSTAVSYVLTVADDGQPTTGVSITLNGRTIVDERALLGSPSTLSVNVSVEARNRMSVRPLGSKAATVTVTIQGGATIASVVGGTVVAPGSGSTLSLPANAIGGRLIMGLHDDTSLAPRYAALASSGMLVFLDLSDPNLTIGTGSLRLSVPLTHTVPAGFVAGFRVRVAGLEDDLWLGATPTGSRLESAIAVAGLTDVFSLLGSNRVTMSIWPEAIPSTSTYATTASGRTLARTGGSVNGATHQCQQGFNTYSISLQTNRTDVVPCNDLPGLHTVQQVPGGTTAIVLIHGIDPGAVDPVDLYRAQSMDCRQEGDDAFLYTCTDNAEDASLPAGEYFTVRPSPGAPATRGLTPVLAAAFPTIPIYGYSYPTYYNIATNGAALAAQLQTLAATPGAPSRVILVAHSMGGMVARSAAALVPNLTLGVITLGTPHEGTPIVKGGFFLQHISWLAGTQTAGGQDLLPPADGGYAPPALPSGVRMTVYAGDVTWQKFPCPLAPPLWTVTCALPTTATVGAAYVATGAVLCLAYSKCRGDGVVPDSSAMPAPYPPRSFAYDHTQLHQGLGGLGTDPLHAQLVKDIKALLPTAPTPPTAGKIAYLSSGGTEVWLLDPATGNTQRVVGPIPPTAGFHQSISAVRLSRDGTLLAYAVIGEALHTLDLVNGGDRTYAQCTSYPGLVCQVVTFLAWSGDGGTLAATDQANSNFSTFTIDLATGTTLGVSESSTKPTLDWSPTSAVLLAQGTGTPPFLSALFTGSPVSRGCCTTLLMEGAGAARYSKDGTTLIGIRDDSAVLRIAADGSGSSVLYSGPVTPHLVDESPDGKHVAVVDDLYQLHFLDLTTGRLTATGIRTFGWSGSVSWER